MAVTQKPHFQPVILYDQDGNAIASVVSGALRRLAVDAFISGGGAVGTVFQHTASQDLSLAPLSTTTAFASTHRPSFVALHLSVPLPGPQTLTITYDSGAGAAFDTVIQSLVLAAATQDFIFYFPDGAVHTALDELRVQLTNVGAPAVTANVTVNASD